MQCILVHRNVRQNIKHTAESRAVTLLVTESSSEVGHGHNYWCNFLGGNEV